MSEQTVAVQVTVPGAIITLHVPTIQAQTAIDAAYARYERAKKNGTPQERVRALNIYCDTLEAVHAAVKSLGERND